MNEATDSMEFPKTWGEFADYYGYVDRSKEIFVGEIEVIPRFRVEQWIEHIEPAVFPAPCVRDERGEIKEQTVKQLFDKVDEELVEAKSEILDHMPADSGVAYAFMEYCFDRRKSARIRVAEEIADTITALTTLAEALGIDAEMRSEAQRRVNEKNHNRGRL